jgi:hypothetical protein
LLVKVADTEVYLDLKVFFFFFIVSAAESLIRVGEVWVATGSEGVHLSREEVRVLVSVS